MFIDDQESMEFQVTEFSATSTGRFAQSQMVRAGNLNAFPLPLMGPPNPHGNVTSSTRQRNRVSLVVEDRPAKFAA